MAERSSELRECIPRASPDTFQRTSWFVMLAVQAHSCYNSARTAHLQGNRVSQRWLELDSRCTAQYWLSTAFGFQIFGSSPPKPRIHLQYARAVSGVEWWFLLFFPGTFAFETRLASWLRRCGGNKTIERLESCKRLDCTTATGTSFDFQRKAGSVQLLSGHAGAHRQRPETMLRRSRACRRRLWHSAQQLGRDAAASSQRDVLLWGLRQLLRARLCPPAGAA